MSSYRIILFTLLLSLACAGIAEARSGRTKPLRPDVEVNLGVLDQMGVPDPDTYSRIAPSAGTYNDMYVPGEPDPIRTEFVAVPEAPPARPVPVEPVYQNDIPEEATLTIIDPYSKVTRVYGQKAFKNQPEVKASKPYKTTKKQAKSIPHTSEIAEHELVEPTAQDIFDNLQGN
jgi:hypothetical protein